MALQDFDQELSLKPKLGQVVLHSDGSVTIQVNLCDAADESRVLGYRSLTVPASGSVMNDKGEDCGVPGQTLLDAVAAYKDAIEDLVDAQGQDGKLDI